MGYITFLQNISLGYEHNVVLKKEFYKDLKEFITFKKTKKANNDIDFSKEEILSGNFKCINWFKYTFNSYLSFFILKARNLDTQETYYFHFKYFNYVFYRKDDIYQNNDLKNLYEYSLNKTSIYDIYSYILKDCLEIKVAHYKNYNTMLNYYKEIDEVIENINDTIKGDIYILATNFIQDISLSSCENKFMDSRVFYLLNNIEPSCAFSLNNFKINKGILENSYFIKTSNIQSFFKNKIEILKNDVSRYYISFDIESDVNKTREVGSPHNIITHCAIEYYVSNFYTKFYDKKVKPFNFCLINKDFHYLTILYKYKNKYFEEDSKYYNNKDILYTDIRNNNISDELRKIIKKEIKDIKNKTNYVYIKEKDLEKTNEEFKNLFEGIKYVFTNEVNLIKIIFKIFHIYETDYILTYNGNNYDFPQLGKRLSLLTNNSITKKIIFRSLYDNEVSYYGTSNNLVTNYSISNMIIRAPYFSVDLFNYVKKFYQNENSFSLKEISKKLFNIDAICKCILKTSKFYEYEIILLYQENINDIFDFIKVLLSSNYCFINNISYIIYDKSEIIKKQDSIYDINIEKLCNDFTEIKNVKFLKSFKIRSISNIDNNLNHENNFTFENYKKFIRKINLSKDDVEISSSDIAEKISNIEVSNYCIHDTLLCRYLFEKYLVKENIDIYSNLNYLPQYISLCYRNNTNINGYILKTCLKEKIFLMKSKKIAIESFSGGKVFEPKQNFIKEPVLVFDFESLYPSIIIKYNISPECLVLAVKSTSIIEFNLLKISIKEKFPPEHYTVIYNIDDKDENNIYYNIVVYTKIYKDKTKRNGLLNIMLQDLKKIRKEYKALVKKYKSENIFYMHQHCNITQNNVKLIMNCVYGLMGSEFSMFSCKFSSLSVTTLGVKNITFLEQYLHNAKISNNMISINNLNYKSEDLIDEDNKLEVYNPGTQKKIELSKNINIVYPFKHELFMEIIYGDTDSIMVILKNINIHPYILENKDEYEKRIIKLTSFLGNKINLIINNDILENSGLNIEFENIILEMIIQSKKKYLGKSIEPIKIDLYEDLNKPIKDLEFKEFNKGTSIKRRDICGFQKKTMIKFHKLLKNIIIENRYTETNINVEKIYNNIWNFIEKEIKDIIGKYLEDKINITDFLISSSFTDNYKRDDNHIGLLIKKYNNTAKDKINKGDRFNYIYVRNIENNETDEELKKLKNKKIITLIDICKFLNWKNIDVKINDYKIIYDENLDLKFSNQKICFEIYINKLISDIITLFPESKILKKKIKESYNSFLSQIKYS